MELTEIAVELRAAAQRLERAVADCEEPKLAEPIQRLFSACMQVGDASSGSWLGYHSLVYYADFRSPPAGAHFSSEWGIFPATFGATTGDWQEYRHEDVVRQIEFLAHDPNIDEAQTYSAKATKTFQFERANVVSLLTIASGIIDDPLVREELEVAKTINPLTQADSVRLSRPIGPFSSRDSKALDQGLMTPPHISYLSGLVAIVDPGKRCGDLALLANRAAQHLERVPKKAGIGLLTETCIFIGHGHSLVWRELKDFISGRLGLKWEEFDRISSAGVATKERLSTLLEASNMAFLVCTAEDDHDDGSHHARENVIHEAGLFQGHLGFEKAIVVLEDGCSEFSNIHGLGQIRFPAGRISACFEDVRRVLEREGVISPP